MTNAGSNPAGVIRGGICHSPKQLSIPPGRLGGERKAMNIKHLFINPAFGLLCWLIMISCVLLVVQAIGDDPKYDSQVEVEIRPTMIRAGYFDVYHVNGLDYYYPRKQRF